jgi:Tellurite resistance protein TerB
VRGGSIFDGPELRQLWNKVRATVTGDRPPEDSKKTLTLEVRPEEVKVLYARALALQSLVDGWLDPREIEYLYVFMSRVSMSSDSREEVRQTLATREASPEDVVRLVEEAIWAVPDNQEEIAVSIIKDMVHLSRADNAVLPQEKAAIEAAAEAHFGERAPKVVELAERTLNYE